MIEKILRFAGVFTTNQWTIKLYYMVVKYTLYMKYESYDWS